MSSSTSLMSQLISCWSEDHNSTIQDEYLRPPSHPLFQCVYSTFRPPKSPSSLVHLKAHQIPDLLLKSSTKFRLYNLRTYLNSWLNMGFKLTAREAVKLKGEERTL